MADTFDPYHKWFGIPPVEQPPNHYRLLAVTLFETDPEVIEAAADQRMAHLRTFQSGKRSALSQQMLNEVAAAKICLLSPGKRVEYDIRLKADLAEQTQSVAPPTTDPVKLDRKSSLEKIPLWIPLVIGGSGAILVLLVVATILFWSGNGSPRPDPDDPVVVTPETVPPIAPPVQTGLSTTEQVTEPEHSNTSTASTKLPTQEPTTTGTQLPMPKRVSHEDLAVIEFSVPSEICPLRPNQRIPGPEHHIISRYSTLLNDLQFVRWPHESEGDVILRVLSPGVCYLLVRDQDVTSLTETFRAFSARPVQIRCELIDPPAKRFSCTVLECELPDRVKAKVNFSGNRPWLILATKEIRIAGSATEITSTNNVGNESPIKDEAPEPDEDHGSHKSPGSNGSFRPPPPRALPVIPSKHPIPSPKAQAKALDELNSVFDLQKKDRTFDEMRALASTLVMAGNDSSDTPDAQFMAYRKACEVAANAGDLGKAFHAVEEIDKRFDADKTAMRLRALSIACQAKVSIKEKGILFAHALPVIDEAIEADLFDESEETCSSLILLANRLKQREMSRSLIERRKLIDTAKKRFSKIESALVKLKETPDDPESNSLVGRYLCLVKGDWDEGLKKLALGNDQPLKQVAKEDLDEPTDTFSRLKVADAWYDIAEKERGEDKPGLLQRAGHWYQLVVSDLSGLEKLKVEKQIVQIQGVLDNLAKLNRPKTIFPCKGLILASSDYRLAVAVNGRIVIDQNAGGTVEQASGTFNIGDVIIVRVRRTSSSRAFACAIQFEGSTRVIATGTRDSGWMTYRPASVSNWETPGQGTAVGSVVQLGNTGHAHQRIQSQYGVQCTSIWGNIEESPGSSFSNTYMILKIK